MVEKKKPLVMVVEDDPNSQMLVKFFLRDNYDTYFAVSVTEAKEKLDNQPVELILLDLSLEGQENGLDLVRYLRKTKRWKDILIIAVTAHAFTADREKCLAAGCDDYLAKPYRKADLLEKMKQFV